MKRLLLSLPLLVAGPAAAQDYTVIAVSHIDNKVSEVHPVTGEILQEFFVPGEWYGETHEGVITADQATAYISIPYAKQVIILDLENFTQTGVIESRYFSRPPEVRRFARIGERESTSSDPHGLALTPDGRKLYITVQFAEVPGIVIYDTVTEEIRKIDTVSAGNHLAVHPSNGKLYYPTRDFRVVVLDTATDEILRVIPLHQGSRPTGIAFGGPNGEAWVNGDGDGSVTVIDTRTDEIIEVIRPRVSGGGRTAVSPDGRLAASTHGPEVSVIDTRTREILASLRISPEGDDTGHGFPVFSPDSRTLHVMNETSHDMVNFDMETMTRTGPRIPIGATVFGGGIRLLEH